MDQIQDSHLCVCIDLLPPEMSYLNTTQLLIWVCQTMEISIPNASGVGFEIHWLGLIIEPQGERQLVVMYYCLHRVL